MRRHSALLITILAWCVVLVGRQADAACTLPYTLTNGNTADASQVMADLNALITCLTSAAPAGTQNALQYNGGNGSFGAVGPLTNGQIPIGSTGNAPQAATLSAGAGVTITNGPGSITISATGGGGGPGLWSQVMSSAPRKTATGLTNNLNLGSVTVTETQTGISFAAPSDGSSQQLRGIYGAAPATPYHIVGLSSFFALGDNYSSCAVGWYDGTNKLQVVLFGNTNGSLADLEIANFSTPSTYVSGPASANAPTLPTLLWWRLSDDGTNVSFDLGSDGETWVNFYTVAKSSGYLGSSGYSKLFIGTRAYAAPLTHSLLSWSVH